MQGAAFAAPCPDDERGEPRLYPMPCPDYRGRNAMSTEPKVEWVNRFAMREVAEAVGTTTELVMAVHSDGICLYTPEGTEEIWRCQISRDADGIAVAGPGEKFSTFDEFHAEMRRRLEGSE
jgi:hypothetical protein